MTRSLVAATSLMLIAASAPLTQAQVGPAPSWTAAVNLGEAAVRAELKDPNSAQVEWPYHFVAGSLKGALGRRRYGYFTCGRVNAKNAMGGYAGRQWFLIMIRGGAVTELDIGHPDGIDPASASCPDFVKSGMLTPVPVLAPPAAP